MNKGVVGTLVAATGIVYASPCSQICDDTYDTLMFNCFYYWSLQMNACDADLGTYLSACGLANDLCHGVADGYGDGCRQECNNDSQCILECDGTELGMHVACNLLLGGCEGDAWFEYGDCVADTDSERAACESDAWTWWDNCMTSCGC